MIDIQLLRKSPEEIAARLAARGAAAFDLPQFQRLEAARKEIQTRVEQAQASKNRIDREIGQAKGKGQDAKDLLAQAEGSKADLEASQQELARIQSELQDFLQRIPNIPHASVPVGASDADNREERRWGQPRKFDFAAKDHVDVGEALGGLDFATGAKLAEACGNSGRPKRIKP